MSNLANILANGGMKDWTVKEWGAFYALTAGFITATATPFLLMIFSHIKGLQRRTEGAEKSAVDARVRAAEADTKASAAVTSISKTNDRVNEVALATPAITPAAPPNPPTPTATGISAAMRAQEQTAQRPNIPK